MKKKSKVIKKIKSFTHRLIPILCIIVILFSNSTVVNAAGNELPTAGYDSAESGGLEDNTDDTATDEESHVTGILSSEGYGEWIDDGKGNFYSESTAGEEVLGGIGAVVEDVLGLSAVMGARWIFDLLGGVIVGITALLNWLMTGETSTNVAGVVDGSSILLKSYNFTLDGAIFGRVITGKDAINYLTFELAKGNPYGIIGARVYTFIRALTYAFVPFIALFMLFKKITAEDTKTKIGFKEFFYNLVLFFLLIYVMPQLIDFMMWVRDGLLSGLRDLFGLDKSFSITALYFLLWKREPNIVSAIIYACVVFCSFSICKSYIGVALKQTALFSMFPVVNIMAMKNKRLLNMWAVEMFTNIFIPVIDAVLFMIPYTVMAIANNSTKPQGFLEWGVDEFLNHLLISENAPPGIAIIVVLLFGMIVPTRNSILKLLGNTGVLPQRGGIGGLMAAGMMMLRNVGSQARGLVNGGGTGAPAPNTTKIDNAMASNQELINENQRNAALNTELARLTDSDMASTDDLRYSPLDMNDDTDRRVDELISGREELDSMRDNPPIGYGSSSDTDIENVSEPQNMVGGDTDVSYNSSSDNSVDTADNDSISIPSQYVSDVNEAEMLTGEPIPIDANMETEFIEPNNEVVGLSNAQLAGQAYTGEGMPGAAMGVDESYVQHMTTLGEGDDVVSSMSSSSAPSSSSVVSTETGRSSDYVPDITSQGAGGTDVPDIAEVNAQGGFAGPMRQVITDSFPDDIVPTNQVEFASARGTNLSKLDEARGVYSESVQGASALQSAFERDYPRTVGARLEDVLDEQGQAALSHVSPETRGRLDNSRNNYAVARQKFDDAIRAEVASGSAYGVQLGEAHEKIAQSQEALQAAVSSGDRTATHEAMSNSAFYKQKYADLVSEVSRSVDSTKFAEGSNFRDAAKGYQTAEKELRGVQARAIHEISPSAALQSEIKHREQLEGRFAQFAATHEGFSASQVNGGTANNPKPYTSVEEYKRQVERENVLKRFATLKGFDSDRTKNALSYTEKAQMYNLRAEELRKQQDALARQKQAQIDAHNASQAAIAKQKVASTVFSVAGAGAGAIGGVITGAATGDAGRNAMAGAAMGFMAGGLGVGKASQMGAFGGYSSVSAQKELEVATANVQARQNAYRAMQSMPTQDAVAKGFLDVNPFSATAEPGAFAPSTTELYRDSSSFVERPSARPEPRNITAEDVISDTARRGQAKYDADTERVRALYEEKKKGTN